MRNNYLTKIYGTGFSSGANTEQRLKLIATIILALCIVILIVTRSSIQEFLNFLMK